jgi:hypothetical protein
VKVIRAKLADGHWVGLSNDAVRDHRLSWRARGLLAELLSYPDGWETSVEKLVRQARREGGKSEGRDAMLKAMTELKDAGYVAYRKFRNDEGRWATEMVVCDVPCPPGRSDRPTEYQETLNISVSVPPGQTPESAGGTDTLEIRPPGFQGLLKKTVTKTESKDVEDQDQKTPLPTLRAGPLPAGRLHAAAVPIVDTEIIDSDDYWAEIDRQLLGPRRAVQKLADNKGQHQTLKEHQS